MNNSMKMQKFETIYFHRVLHIFVERLNCQHNIWNRCCLAKCTKHLVANMHFRLNSALLVNNFIVLKSAWQTSQ